MVTSGSPEVPGSTPAGTSHETTGNPSGPADPAATRADVERRVRELEELVNLRTRERELLSQLADPILPDSSATRQREEDDSSSDDGKELKTENIEIFTLKFNFRKREEWINDLERAFEGAPKKYRKDRKKILLGLQHMDSECRARWSGHLREQTEARRIELKKSWDDYIPWTLTLIKEASNLAAALTKELDDARQRETQTPMQFHSYLDSLEQQFPREEEKQRALKYYAKLETGLRNHIDLHVAKIPEKREDIVSLATRY